MKAQAALEYLTAHSWAIIILLIAIGVLLYIGVVNPKGLAPSACLFPSDVTCHGYKLMTDGSLILDLGQSTGHPVKITKFKCTQQTDPTLEDIVDTDIANGDHATIVDRNAFCYNEANNPATGRQGDQYKGKLYIEYVETDTNFPHVVVGDIIAKYEPVPSS